MLRVTMVVLGGALGSLARFGLTSVTQRWAGPAFPLGTLVVNVFGCFAAGLLAAWLATRAQGAESARLFGIVGVLGGFTTFSAFGLDTLALLRDGRTTAALGNVAANVLLGLGAVALGWCAARGLVS